MEEERRGGTTPLLLLGGPTGATWLSLDTSAWEHGSLIELKFKSFRGEGRKFLFRKHSTKPFVFAKTFVYRFQP